MIFYRASLEITTKSSTRTEQYNLLDAFRKTG
jgi:hypothetical protein